MKLLYACNFDLNRYSGKNRATNQKLTVLSALVRELNVISAGKYLFTDIFIIDIKSVIAILGNRPDIFISRGYTGLLPIILGKLIGCKTIREVHADSIGEADLLDKNVFLKKLSKFAGLYASIIDRVADVRIFNHPKLMDWYNDEYLCGPNDFYCYNGYLKSNINDSNLNKDLIRSNYGLSQYISYFVFAGSASHWHGITYLVDLQKELNEIGANIKIICAGGEVKNKTDPENVLIKIWPLDDTGCDELIGIAEACLLPVRDTRVSPGSPLKLYDYIKHQKFIITQEEMLGYSDEVETYGRGICVDFKDARETARVLSKLDTSMPILTPIDCFSWNARMKKWINMFEGILQRDGP
jgi:hypothetical protein